MSPLIIAIVGVVVLALLIVMFVLSRITVAGPNEAFIVTGRKGRSVRGADGSMVTDLSGQKVVMGAAVFVLPIVQRLYKLNRQGRRYRRDDPTGRATIPAPAGPDRGLHRAGTLRGAARGGRPAHRRGDHP
jgi:hypothetical protein